MVQYESFSDASILEVAYKAINGNYNAEVVIHCMNSNNDYRFETIRVFFIDVVSIRFLEQENQSSTVINTALLKLDSDLITFDFFPLLYGESRVEENANSDFKIKCRRVKYVKIS